MSVRVVPYHLPATFRKGKMADPAASSPPHSPKTPTRRSPSTSATKEPGSQSPMSIDLSSIPPLVPPSPPSNTLIITNLNNPAVFDSEYLSKLQLLFSNSTPLNSFSPLPSFHRLIISYPTTDAAIATRHELENPSRTSAFPPSIFQPQGTSSSPSNTNNTDPQLPPKIYFGAPTPLISDLNSQEIHLKAPSLGKLLFISPPPSPPCGWEIREEEPPNKQTHAHDLEQALAAAFPTTGGEQQQQQQQQQQQHDSHMEGSEDGSSSSKNLKGIVTHSPPFSATNHNSNNNADVNDSNHMILASDDDDLENDNDNPPGTHSPLSAGGVDDVAATTVPTEDDSTRQQQARRRNTVTVYHPRDHGGEEGLPAVMVEDTTTSSAAGGLGGGLGVGGGEEGIKGVRTARPPVELLMED